MAMEAEQKNSKLFKAIFVFTGCALFLTVYLPTHGARLPDKSKITPQAMTAELIMKIGSDKENEDFFNAISLADSLIISPQQVTTSVRVYDEIFLTDAGLLALPDKAIEFCQKQLKSSSR
ncbi:MAG TPA: hypothetical protein PKZ60_05835 [Candidatus Saccharicenans sp.]|nr:hypothetical protein [Candidatus Saccharicenans sp.]